jgi:hypothetical protein
MEQPDILDQSPSRIIRAARLWELARDNVIFTPLTHQWNVIQAYRVDAQGGPYLMLTHEFDVYHEKCGITPLPHLIALS